jgi:hypothetical protein
VILPNLAEIVRFAYYSVSNIALSFGIFLMQPQMMSMKVHWEIFEYGKEKLLI